MKIMEPRRKTRRTRGQALAEMGLVILLFTTITLAIIDFGRMLMILNVITHAARDGARIAALTPPASWAGQQGAITAAVNAQIATVTTTTFTVSQACNVVNGLPEVSVTVDGPEAFLFSFPGLWGGNVDINRVATYRYEPLQATCPS
jgi:Flp pilus assembly protein TadG